MPNFNAPAATKRHAEPGRYRPGDGTCVTPGDPAAMVEDAEDFVVHHAKADSNVTRFMLKQDIIGRIHHG